MERNAGGRDARNLIGSHRGLGPATEKLPTLMNELLATEDGEALVREAVLEAIAESEEEPPDRERRTRELARFEARLAEALALLEREDLAADPDVMTAPRDQLASIILSRVTRSKAAHPRYGEASSGGVEVLEAKFDKSDLIGWVKDFFKWVRDRRNFHPLERPETSRPEPFPNEARVALFSDWGTGLYGAPVLAATIRGQADEFDLIMHLGDVYYSGGPEEITERCIAHWPDPDLGSGRGRALNANHEMYRGGHAYFDILLHGLGQKTSYFALQNDHWTLVALDTAWVDHAIDREQLEWVFAVMREAGPNRRILLFSHHQLFSRLESQGDRLAHALGPKLKAGRFAGWYWGHEHHCFIYDPDPRNGGLLGRCLGHGGIPYRRYEGDEATVEREVDDRGTRWLRFGSSNTVPGGLLLDGPNRYVTGHREKYGPHGYMTLEFDGPTLIERVHDPDGDVLLEAPFPRS